MSPVGRELLEQRAKSTTGLHTLSVSKVSGIPIPVPSIAEQEEIIVPVQGVRRSTKTLLRGALLAVREI
jgi:type I restriction enzyme S subunit